MTDARACSARSSSSSWWKGSRSFPSLRVPNPSESQSFPSLEHLGYKKQCTAPLCPFQSLRNIHSAWKLSRRRRRKSSLLADRGAHSSVVPAPNSFAVELCIEVAKPPSPLFHARWFSIAYTASPIMQEHIHPPRQAARRPHPVSAREIALGELAVIHSIFWYFCFGRWRTGSSSGRSPVRYLPPAMEDCRADRRLQPAPLSLLLSTYFQPFNLRSMIQIRRYLFGAILLKRPLLLSNWNPQSMAPC